MKYAYEDLSDSQFEDLIVFLCQNLFGISVQGFAKGPDGGRDAKFSGKAELFPSKANPWVGITIIQAKHTNGYNRHFSDSDFYNPTAKRSVLGEEIPRIRKLRAAKNLDNYILFSNRRLGGNSETEIREYIAKECDLPTESVYLCDIEQLERWMKSFPTVATLVCLDPVDSPLIVSPDDLATVVEALGRHVRPVTDLLQEPSIQRVSYEKKNKLNNMTPEYAKALWWKYLKETAQIRAFLAAPENFELQGMYESITDEFQLKIIAKRKDHQTFDAVMEYLVDLLFNRDAILRQRPHKRLTRAVLFYMYWNCDIGVLGDVEAN